MGLAQMNSVSPREPEGSELALAGRELPETAVSESRMSQAVDESESNGQTDTAVAEDSSAAPESRGSNARDSLGSRASETETDAETQQRFDPAELPIPGADESDSVAPSVVISTPEEVAAARQFFIDAKAAESANQKKRARTRSRVFSVMQYHRHPVTGAVIFTQEQLDGGLAALGSCLYRWAYIWHDCDRLVEVDEGTTEMTCVGIKGLHVHLVLWVKDAGDSRPTVRTVSDEFSIPSPRVRVPNEVGAQEGIADHKGRNAAEKAFFDLCEYLVHETRTSSGLVGMHHPDRHYLVDESQPGNPGKYQYGRGRVVSNFEFGSALDGHMATRHNVAEGGGGAKISKLFQAVGQGSLTLKQVRDQEPAIYFAKGNLAHFQKLRGDFLAHQDAPGAVMNFYVFGEGGTGKDLLAKALARSLAPDAERPYFKVGGDNVSWEGYDGEPVVIWEDMRVGDMIRTAKSRGMLFRILGPWREPDEKPVVNIKNAHTQLLNRVNIVTGPEGYDDFLRGLAGEYESMQGGVKVKHQAENLGQGYRRFPLVIPVGEREFGIYVNLGVLNGTREYQSYEKYERMRQDLELVARRCKAIKDGAERLRVRHQIEAQTVAPILEHHDRIAQPVVEEASADDILAEFADVGQEIQPSADSAVARAVTGHDAVIIAEQQRVESERRQAELRREEEVQRLRETCTCESFPPYAWLHGDDCPVLPNEERQKRAAKHRAELDAKVARLRANGGLLTVGGAA